MPRRSPRGPLSSVPTHLVFAQGVDSTLPVSVLTANAARHFDLSLAVSEPERETRVEVKAEQAAGSYLITVRPRSASDLAHAEAAEQRGTAAGMSALAARCGLVWVIEASPESPEWLTWDFCALLALTALGPILPEDGSTLLGVKSARALAVRLKAESQTVENG